MSNSHSDPTTGLIASPYGNVSVVPVEIRTENKPMTGNPWTDVYSITKFRPFISTRDELWVVSVYLIKNATKLSQKEKNKIGIF